MGPAGYADHAEDALSPTQRVLSWKTVATEACRWWREALHSLGQSPNHPTFSYADVAKGGEIRNVQK
jgi:hypothetical protein